MSYGTLSTLGPLPKRTEEGQECSRRGWKEKKGVGGKNRREGVRKEERDGGMEGRKVWMRD